MIPEEKIHKYTAEDLAYTDEEDYLIERVTRCLNLSIQTVELNNLDLYSLKRYLERITRDYDEEGIGVDIAVQNKKNAPIRITINAKNITIRQILERVSKLAQVNWIIDNGQIILGRFSEKKMMIKKTYNLNSELALEVGDNIKDFFVKKGLSFAKGSSIQLTHNHILIINTLQEEHLKLTAILLKWLNKQQFAITAQLFEIDPNILKKSFELKELLALSPESTKILDSSTIQLLEGKKGKTRKGGIFLEAMCSNSTPEVWHCHYQWSYKENGKNFGQKETIKISAIEDRIIDLGLKKGKRYILLLSARLVDSCSEPLKRKSLDALRPSGKLYLFQDKAQTKERIFLPRHQDEYLKNYHKLKKTQ